MRLKRAPIGKTPHLTPLKIDEPWLHTVLSTFDYCIKRRPAICGIFLDDGGPGHG